jgi:two-component system, NarL family, response regulator NreC
MDWSKLTSLRAEFGTQYFGIHDAIRFLMPIRVLIVEDSDALRQSVCSMLRDCSDLQVIGEACDGVQAINQSKELQPDVILLDVSMPKLNGLRAAPCILQVSPQSKILMFSQHDASYIVSAALNAGALGYVVKSDVERDLLAGLRTISKGEQFLSSGVTAY